MVFHSHSITARWLGQKWLPMTVSIKLGFDDIEREKAHLRALLDNYGLKIGDKS